MTIKKCLITGGAGFIGSNLALEMKKRKISFDIVDNMSNGHLAFLPDDIVQKNLYQTDFTSEFILNKIRHGSYDVVFHLAALPRVGYSVEHPFNTNDENVTKTLALMEACRGNVARFVFASSSSVYGNTTDLPAKETARKNPQSPYALQKSIIEDYLKLYYDLYGMDSAALRFFNVFGPHQLGDSPYSTAVSAWLNAIQNGESMRSDGDGSQSRDMCYVDNVVDVLIRAGTLPTDLAAETFNVACGESTTNKEILRHLLLKNPATKYHSAPWRSGDVKHTLADISKTEQVLGYKPLVRFWDGLEITSKWYKDNWRLIKEIK